jgi:hypothetical protein
MSLRTHPLPVLLLAGLALTASGAQAYSGVALVRAGAATSVIGGGFGGTGDSPADRSVSTDTGELVSISNQAYAEQITPWFNVVGSGAAWAQVAPGALQLRAMGSGSGNSVAPSYWQTDNSGYAHASASFASTVTLNIAGVAPGQLVNMDFALRFDGVSSVTRNVAGGGWAQGGVDYQWGFQLASPGWGAGAGYVSGVRSRLVDATGTVTVDSLDFGTKSFSAMVMTGVPLSLNLWGWVQAFGRGGTPFCPAGCTDQMQGGGVGLMDASHTLAWNGVQGVSLLDGTRLDLADVSLLGETGLNLLQPVASVPEPVSAWLLAVGLAVLSVTQRRLSRHRAGTDAG